MSNWVVLVLPSLAQSLATSRWHAATDGAQHANGLCDSEALYKAHRVGNDWKALKGSPCITEQIYKALESGDRDPADNVEFLGDVDLPDLSDVHVVPTAVDGESSAKYPTMFPKVQFLGLPHSGSTSLAKQMNLHPQLSHGWMKEHKFVFNVGSYPMDYLRKVYETTFVLTTGEDQSNVKYTFDATPDTIFIGCPDDQRMKELPIGENYGGGVKAVEAVREFLGDDTKYIIMLRDPIDWEISDYENPTLNFSLEHALHGTDLISARSCYADCIEAWVQVMGRNQILFLESSEYFVNPQETLDKIFNFLGLEAKTYTTHDLGISEGRRRAQAREASVPASDRKLYWQDARVKECKSRLEDLTQRQWPWEP